MPQSLRCTHGILIHSTSSEPQPKPDIHSKTHTHTQYEIQQGRVFNFTEEKEEEVANQRVVRNRAANLWSERLADGETRRCWWKSMNADWQPAKTAKPQKKVETLKTGDERYKDWSSDGVVFFFFPPFKAPPNQTLLADGRQEIYLHTTGFKPVLGGYHNFMMPSGPVFTKYGTRRIRFSPKNKILHWVEVSTFDFFNFEPVLTMPVLRNLRTAGSPLLVLTNQVLLFFIWNRFLEIKIK